MGIKTKHQLNFSRQIKVTNADGTDTTCVSCFATVQANSSLAVTYDIIDDTVFKANKHAVKAAIKDFMDYTKVQSDEQGIEVL